jgi:hypothetical protein
MLYLATVAEICLERFQPDDMNRPTTQNGNDRMSCARMLHCSYPKVGL